MKLLIVLFMSLIAQMMCFTHNNYYPPSRDHEPFIEEDRQNTPSPWLLTFPNPFALVGALFNSGSSGTSSSCTCTPFSVAGIILKAINWLILNNYTVTFKIRTYNSKLLPT